MGRAGLAGDENGSAIIGSRIARDVMRLAFLMEKQYPPYPKWFGTAFLRLECSSTLVPILTRILHSATWEEREDALCRAYQMLGEIHNSLKITESISPEISRFFGRPFRVIRGERFAKNILQKISDPELVPLTRRSLIGNIDIISDNTDVLEDPSLRPNILGFFE
jgi:hypothetical protein